MTIVDSQLKKVDRIRQRLHQHSKKIKPWVYIGPCIGLLLSLLTTKDISPIPIFCLIGWLIPGLIYHLKIELPFKKIKTDYKNIVVREFMRKYHPNVRFDYFGDIKDVESIIMKCNIVEATQYEEEDVIIGRIKDTHFYFSQLNLKKQKGKNNHHVFEGLLIKLNLRNKRYPDSIIQSKPELFDSKTEGLKFNSDYEFHYDTDDEKLMNAILSDLYPFIQHLMSKHNSIKISLKGEEVVILIEKDMKFLNDSEITLDKSLINKSYYENLGKQINSLFYIVEAFAVGFDEMKIIDRLELKELETIELGTNWNENI